MGMFDCFNINASEVNDDKEVKCEQAEYCPTYLAYLGKYGEGSKEIKMCRNSNSDYCTKYNLINQTKWAGLTTDDKVKLVNSVVVKKS